MEWNGVHRNGQWTGSWNSLQNARVGGSGRFFGRRQMLYQRQLGPRMQLSEVYLIHERPDEEDAAAGAAQKIFRRQGIGKGGGIQSLALVG